MSKNFDQIVIEIIQESKKDVFDIAMDLFKNDKKFSDILNKAKKNDDFLPDFFEYLTKANFSKDLESAMKKERIDIAGLIDILMTNGK